MLQQMLAVTGEHGPVHHAVHLVVGMLAIASAVGIAVKYVRLPYTIALVLVGLLIAIMGAAPEGAYLSEELVLLLFLPPLLFQAGLHTDLDHLRRAWFVVLVLAVPGVLITTGLIAVLARPFLAAALGEENVTWTVALLLGVVMASTDPISVMAAFKAAGVPEKLKTVVEGESLFNDGTCVAFYGVLKGAIIAGVAAGMLGGATIGDAPADAGPGEHRAFVEIERVVEAEAAVGEALVAAAGEASGAGHTGDAGAAQEESLAEQARVTPAEVAMEFVRVAGLGTIFGLGLGLIAFWLLKQIEDHTLEVGITIALAFGSFVLAESSGGSGVIAVVISALIMGNYGTVLGMSPRTRETLTGFWDSIDFVVNSILFLLIGFELSDPSIGGPARLLSPDVLLCAGAVLAALFLARALLVYPTVMLAKPDWPKGWKHVIWFAGIRGSLSLALVLGLPPGELRGFLVPVAFVVVLVSLVGQSLLMPFVIRFAGAHDPERADPAHMNEA